ncbi:hypothetical protein MTR_5g032845 [Medicago truncatula]|uniref:Uncharacterized protein n=1 Tax=Medicago truncatula TaxID=3880 RepID=A0A072UDP1_MEDTR|nr:hypothetical protein MTR_5g032845 [Medicago truncatula]
MEVEDSVKKNRVGIRAVVRLSGEREQDSSVDHASDVDDSYLRGRLLDNQV